MSPDAAAPALFLAALLGPCLWAAWSDLRTMTIPNRVVLLTLGLYVVLGPLVLPLEDYLWRFVPALVALVVGFLLSLTGQFGAGDAKFATAILPFVPARDLASLFVIYAVLALVSVAALALLRRGAPAFAATGPLRSLRERGRFPLGLPLALSILVYLALATRLAVMRS